ALHTIVLGTPGLVHPRTGLATDAGVPGWRPDLLPALRDRLGAPVVVENEVNLAAVAEHRVGAAAGHDDFALLWLDDGIGAAVVLDGRLRRGASGGAGEVGPLRFGGEQFCALLEAGAVRGLAPAALADRIVGAVFALVAVLDPGLVVLGGATGRDGGELLAGLVAERLAPLSPAPTEVRASAVEGNTILQGAVLTALGLARDDVFG
ncbi:ROK family protein, partial [Actinomadura fibrosa]